MPESKTYTRFDGGIVDGYLDTDSNRYYVADNLYVDENGKFQTRYGLSIGDYKIPSDAASPQITGVYFYPKPLQRGVWVTGEDVWMNFGSGFTDVQGPTGNPGLIGKEAGALEQVSYWRGQLIMCPNGNGYVTTTRNTQAQRLYCADYGANSYSVVELGLPRPVGTVSSSYTAGANPYVYALHWRYTLTDWEGTTFEEDGPVLFYELPTNSSDPGTFSVTLNDLPTLANGITHNYATASVKLQIFRTLSAGNAYYYVGEVANGVTTYVDSTSDTTLSASETIYTDGGILEWDQPPADSLWVTEVNDYFWYAGQGFVTHSIQGAPGACPSSYVYFTSEKVRGLSDIIGFPILFCDKAVYRIEGNYDEFGNEGFALRKISGTAGCLSSRGVVKVPGGLAWPGNGGFYFTDGYSVIRLSEYIPTRYNSWGNANMVGAYDSVFNFVYWTFSSQFSPRASASVPVINDSIVAWNMRLGVKGDACFTTYSFRNNVFPSSIFFTESLEVSEDYRARLLIGDARSYFLYQDPNRYTDPKIDITQAISTFVDTAIVWDFQTALEDQDDPANRRYGTHVTMEAGTETDVSIQIQVRRDDTGPWVGTPEIRQDAGILWDITDATWGTPSIDYEWIAQRIVEAKRTVPYNQQRSQRRQLRFTKSYTKIYNSDTLGLVNVTASSPYPTITLLGGAVWPDSPEEYYIAFDDDTYTNRYQIRERVSDTVLTVYDPYVSLTAKVSAAWEISGYRKFERFNLLSYTVFYEADGMTQRPSNPTPQGANS